jgi:hypothetical protein
VANGDTTRRNGRSHDQLIEELDRKLTELEEKHHSLLEMFLHALGLQKNYIERELGRHKGDSAAYQGRQRKRGDR